MANKEHLSILKQGIVAWNQWREKNTDIEPDLGRADLNRADLRGVRLNRVHLVGVNFRGATLIGANLAGAYLLGADLEGAKLNGADLIKARLNGARLSGADLRGARLNGVNLTGADLTGVNLSGATLRGADLSGVNLFGADLDGANLAEAKLKGADLIGTDLSGVNLIGADLTGANLNEADLFGANLKGANLGRANLVETNLIEANLTNCYVYGVSVWNIKGKPREQLNLVITPSDEPTITVDDLEVAQLIYLLLNHTRLRTVVSSVTDRGVLILGHFNGAGLEVMQSIATKLREMKYIPITFNLDRSLDRDCAKAVQTLASLSRFVIVDVGGTSIPQEFYSTIPNVKIPFVPIIERSKDIRPLPSSLLEYPWVVWPPLEFASKEELVEVMLSKIVVPAEEMHKERQKLLKQLFPDQSGIKQDKP